MISSEGSLLHKRPRKCVGGSERVISSDFAWVLGLFRHPSEIQVPEHGLQKVITFTLLGLNTHFEHFFLG